MQFYGLVLGVLAVWRVTHLLNAEDGPWDLLVKLRQFAGNGVFGDLLDCFYCLSLWVAAPLAWLLGDGWKLRLLLWPALSAGAILLERLTSPDRGAPAAEYFEEKRNDDLCAAEIEEKTL